MALKLIVHLISDFLIIRSVVDYDTSDTNRLAYSARVHWIHWKYIESHVFNEN